MWPDSSVVRLLGICVQVTGHVLFPFLHDIWWLSIGPCSGCEHQRDCLVGFGIVLSRFGDNSIYPGENVTVQPYGPIAQCSEYSHSL